MPLSGAFNVEENLERGYCMITPDILTLSASVYRDLARQNPCAATGFLVTGYLGQGMRPSPLQRLNESTDSK